MASAQKSTNFVAGWVGILSAAIIMVAIVIAAGTSGWQLGKQGLDVLASMDTNNVFVIGTVIAGILMTAYGGARAATEDDLGMIAAIAAGLAGIALVLFAIFPKSVNANANILFFGLAAILLGVGILVGSYAAWKAGGARRISGGAGIIVLVVFFAALFTMNWQAVAPFLAIAWYTIDCATYIAAGVKPKEVA